MEVVAIVEAVDTEVIDVSERSGSNPWPAGWTEDRREGIPHWREGGTAGCTAVRGPFELASTTHSVWLHVVLGCARVVAHVLESCIESTGVVGIRNYVQSVWHDGFTAAS